MVGCGGAEVSELGTVRTARSGYAKRAARSGWEIDANGYCDGANHGWSNDDLREIGGADPMEICLRSGSVDRGHDWGTNPGEVGARGGARAFRTRRRSTCTPPNSCDAAGRKSPDWRPISIAKGMGCRCHPRRTPTHHGTERPLSRPHPDSGDWRVRARVTAVAEKTLTRACASSTSQWARSYRARRTSTSQARPDGAHTYRPGHATGAARSGRARPLPRPHSTSTPRMCAAP